MTKSKGVKKVNQKEQYWRLYTPLGYRDISHLKQFAPVASITIQGKQIENGDWGIGEWKLGLSLNFVVKDNITGCN